MELGLFFALPGLLALVPWAIAVIVVLWLLGLVWEVIKGIWESRQ